MGSFVYYRVFAAMMAFWGMLIICGSAILWIAELPDALELFNVGLPGSLYILSFLSADFIFLGVGLVVFAKCGFDIESAYFAWQKKHEKAEAERLAHRLRTDWRSRVYKSSRK